MAESRNKISDKLSVRVSLELPYRAQYQLVFMESGSSVAQLVKRLWRFIGNGSYQSLVTAVVYKLPKWLCKEDVAGGRCLRTIYPSSTGQPITVDLHIPRLNFSQ